MEPAEARSILLAHRHHLENLEMLSGEWDKCVLNADQAGRLQTLDKTFVTERIRACLLTQGQLWTALQPALLRPAKIFLAKEVIREQGSTPVAEDSNTSCTSPKLAVSSEPSAQGKDELQESHPESSCQPTTSGVKDGEINLRPMTGTSKVNINKVEVSSSSWQVYQSSWEKLITRSGISPEKIRVDVSGKYPRVWTLPKANPQEVRRWYDFGALASVHTTSPFFTEIKDLPPWILAAVKDTWGNNNQLLRSDVLELYFISAAPEPAGKGNHEAFHYIRLRRPDGNAFGRIKAPPVEEETKLVSTLPEDLISTRRAWGLWVCLTEMDKVKFPFKYFHNTVNRSFLLNTMTGKTTGFAEESFERKRNLLWENIIAASKETRRKFCNMAHFGQWSERICPECPNQKEPEFGKGVLSKRVQARSNEHAKQEMPHKMWPKARQLGAPRKKYSYRKESYRHGLDSYRKESYRQGLVESCDSALDDHSLKRKRQQWVDEQGLPTRKQRGNTTGGPLSTKDNDPQNKSAAIHLSLNNNWRQGGPASNKE